MKEIRLTQGKVALVDDEDYEELNKYKWLSHEDETRNYAQRSSKTVNGNRKTIIMHRIIMNPPKGIQVDHVDGNGLNNQKLNLRICHGYGNYQNRRMRKDSSTGYKGIYYKKSHKRYIADITANGIRHIVGSYFFPLQAAIAYDMAAIKYHGEFARTNLDRSFYG